MLPHDNTSSRTSLQCFSFLGIHHLTLAWPSDLLFIIGSSCLILARLTLFHVFSDTLFEDCLTVRCNHQSEGTVWFLRGYSGFTRYDLVTSLALVRFNTLVLIRIVTDRIGTAWTLRLILAWSSKIHSWCFIFNSPHLSIFLLVVRYLVKYTILKHSLCIFISAITGF